MSFTDRPYQTIACDNLREGWKQFSKQILVLPTGSGKTIISAKVAREFVDAGQRVLFLAHREELLTQTLDKFQRAAGLSAELEKAEYKASLSANVVVGSVQTLTRRCTAWPTDHFGLIIVDECHHTCADSYLNILRHFNAKVCGITATADRSDKKNLGQFWENVAHEVSLFELINQGFLSRIVIKAIPLEIDLSRVHVKKGDYDAAELGETIEPYLAAIAESIKREAAGRRILVFLPLIATSELFVTKCLEAGISARHVDGQSPDRKETLQAFANDEFELLSNSALLFEGYDDPGIDCVVMLRPTKSRPLYCLDSKTEILTESGWKNDVEIGERIAAYDPSTKQIHYVPAIAKVRRQLEQDECFYSLKSQSTDIRVTDQHRMLCDNKRRTGWKFYTAEKLASLKDTSYIPAAGITPREDLPLTDDELRFIGWVMTDGSINKHTNAIAITQGAHQPWLEEIQRVIDSCGFKHSRFSRVRKSQFRSNSDCIVWTISKGKPRGSNKHLRGWGHLAPYMSKEFALPLTRLSRRQFQILIEAIHLGDGTKQVGQAYTRRSYHIATGNCVFAERLQKVAIESGFRCNISKWHNVGRLNPIYTVRLKDQPWHRVGGHYGDRASWVKESWQPEEVWCVQNELSTLVTRRNGKVAIVGNCQAIGRGTRIAPMKENLLLLDFLWLSEKHNLVRPAHLVAQSDEMAELITELAFDSSGEPKDLEELAGEAVHQREVSLREMLEAQRRKKGFCADAMEFCLNVKDLAAAEWEDTMDWHTKPATDKQLALIEGAGIDPKSIRSRGHASALIGTIQERRKMGYATPKQVKFCIKLGHPSADKLTMKQAQEFISSKVRKYSREEAA